MDLEQVRGLVCGKDSEQYLKNALYKVELHYTYTTVYHWLHFADSRMGLDVMITEIYFDIHDKLIKKGKP